MARDDADRSAAEDEEEDRLRRDLKGDSPRDPSGRTVPTSIDREEENENEEDEEESTSHQKDNVGLTVPPPAVKPILLEFLDELMTLFETKNKFIYRRLINIHHAIANAREEVDVESACRELFTRERVRITRRDARLLTGTPFEFDADCIWNELSATNRALVWKWIDEIDARLAATAMMH
jgi:hypothetical protein